MPYEITLNEFTAIHIIFVDPFQGPYPLHTELRVEGLVSAFTARKWYGGDIIRCCIFLVRKKIVFILHELRKQPSDMVIHKFLYPVFFLYQNWALKISRIT